MTEGKEEDNKIDIKKPKNQLNLFGYEKHFKNFLSLEKNTTIPKILLFSGAKGLGKSTFAFHIINYLLSKSENDSYNLSHFSINKNNLSYKNICSNIHPNFFLAQVNDAEQNIKVEKIRDLLKFLNKSAYLNTYKVVLIDEVENLNLNSSNALLKALEEPSSNTIFLLINNNTCKMLNTIKSRCIEFKFFFTKSEKKAILENLISQYQLDLKDHTYLEDLHFDTHGNIVKSILKFYHENENVFDPNFDNIIYLIDKFQRDKSVSTFRFLSLSIEKYYNKLCLSGQKSLNHYYYSYSKILLFLSNMRKFNLDNNNIFIQIKDTLKNEAK